MPSLFLYLAVIIFMLNNGYSQSLTFTEVSLSAGINYTHDYQLEIAPVNYRVAAGVAVGDYNNDGFPDIYVETGDASHNLLFKNKGDGTFTETSLQLGLSLHGFLDIIHTNGWPRGSDQFYDDTTRLFSSNQDGTFQESAIKCGLNDTGQGRGISLLDYDRDGDLDIFIANYRSPPALWRNDLESNHHFINLKLNPKEGATAVGTKVLLYANGQQQIRELRCGTNYNSQNPLELHFGLNTTTIIDSLLILWPDGSLQKQTYILSDQFLIIHQQLPSLSNEEVTIFPNPFDQWLKVQFQCFAKATIKLKIFDMMGQLVTEQLTFIAQDEFYSFDWKSSNLISTLPAGPYLLQILENDRSKIVRKIIKQ